MTDNFTPGWNDPPTGWSSDGSSGDTRSLFNRRLAFPDNTSGNGPNIHNHGVVPPCAPIMAHDPNIVMMIPAGHNEVCGENKLNSQMQQQSVELANDLNGDQIITILNNSLAQCNSMSTSNKQSVERRFIKLKECLNVDSLTANCKSHLSKLASAMERHLFDQAYTIHSTLMVECCSEVSSWMPGVKAIILECKKTLNLQSLNIS